MTIVAVLFGGQNSEYPVSLMSATSVLQNMDEKYNVYAVGITREGTWYHYSGDINNIENDSWINDENNEEVLLSTNPKTHGFVSLKDGSITYVDIILPILHGKNGEDGTIKAICQLNKIPCASCNIYASTLAMDKELTHIVADSYGIPMANYTIYRRSNHPSYEVMFNECETKFGLPFYIKPCTEGSSFGAHKINNWSDFQEYVVDTFKYDEKLLAEEFISGHEAGIGIMGNGKCGDVFEIVVETEMYGYDEKYNGYMTNIYCPAKTVSEQQKQLIKEYGLKIYQALGCDALGRADFFVGERVVFCEINLIPGFTSHSLFPASFKATGMTFTEILNELIENNLKGEFNE